MSTTIITRPIGNIRRENRGIVGDWVAFLTPISAIWVVSVGGQLPYTEVIFLLFFPVLVLTQGRRLWDKEYRTAYLLLGLWVLSQTLTDIFVETSTVSRIRGLARVAFFALDLASISVIIGTSLRRTRIFLLGMIINLIYVAYTADLDMATAWKMALAPAASMAVFLLASPYYVKRKYAWVLLPAIGLAVVNLHYVVRGAMMIDLAVAVLLLPIFPKAATDKHSVTRSRAGRAPQRRPGAPALETVHARRDLVRPQSRA